MSFVLDEGANPLLPLYRHQPQKIIDLLAGNYVYSSLVQNVSRRCALANPPFVGLDGEGFLQAVCRSFIAPNDTHLTHAVCCIMVKTWEASLLNLSEEHVFYMRDDTLAAHNLLWQAALGEQFKPNDQVPDLGGLNMSITTFWLMNEAFTRLADIYQSLEHFQEIQDLATEAYQNGFAFVGRVVEKSQIEKRLLEQHSIVAPQLTRGGTRL